MKLHRPQLTYANVVSSLALFVALGGTSYAVARNSIGTAQLKNNAVTSAKVRNGALQKGDLARSARIGERGPRGPQGPSGSDGGSPSPADFAPEPWKPLNLISGWQNHADTFGNGYERASFLKDKQGEVHLRGLVTQTAGAPSQNSVIAVLPDGYRPARREIFTGFGGNAPEQADRVDILPDGSVLWIVGATGESDYTSLSAITFFAG
jgi:hypothetical protein